MKIKINRDGVLEIERAGKFKVQCCPYADCSCGDWCPLFGEPDINKGRVDILSLCKITLGGTVTDERPKE